MNNNIKISKAAERDIPDLISLLQLLFTIELDFKPDIEKQKKGLKLLLEDTENSCIMTAKNNDCTIGMCTAQIAISTAEGGRTARIEDVVVKEEYRSTGIGTCLLSSVEEWAIKKGVKRLELLYDIDNTPALKFYEKNKWNNTNLKCMHKKLS